MLTHLQKRKKSAIIFLDEKSEDNMDNGLIQALLIGAIILLYTLQSLFSKMFNDAYPGDAKHSPDVFAVVSGAVVAVVSLFFSGFKFGPFRWETLLLGLINAAILYGYDQCIIKASGKGPYSIMMVFSLGGGIVIPALAALLPFYPFNKGVSVTQFVAIAIICVAVYLASVKDDGSEAVSGEKPNLRLFFILSALLALCNGLYGVMFVVQEGVTGVADKQLYVIYTFMGAAIISAVRLFATEKKKVLLPFKQNKKSFLYLMLAAVVSAMAVNVLVLLVGVVNETILYTFDNAGVMLLSALASAFIFKDKLSQKNVIGCIIMTLALVMMGASATIDGWLFG